MRSILSLLFTSIVLVLPCLHRAFAEEVSYDPVAVVFVHVTTILVHTVQPIRVSQRHQRQRAQLLQQLHDGTIKSETKSIKQRVLEALYSIDSFQYHKLAQFESSYQKVPQRQKKVLNSVVNYGHTFRELEQFKSINKSVCQQIIDAALSYYGITREELDEFARQERAANRQPDQESVLQALKLFVRDWAAEGHNERGQTFPCIKEHLKDHFLAGHDAGTEPVNILVPGAGLGRLAHEIANLSPRCLVTANEWSSFVNVAYHFLETIKTPRSVSVYPFIDSWSHLKTKDEMRRQISVPDVHINTSQVLLVEGDFARAFKKSSSEFDAVVTLFFIDTARNLMNYFDTISQVLKPGGVWVNFGPLLYGTSPWVQLSLEEIIQVAEAMGFEFLETDDACGHVTLPGHHVRGKEAWYNFNSSSLNRFAYYVQFWVARKR